MTRRSLAIARHELRLTRRDLSGWVQMLLMPVAMIAFLKPVFAPVLQAEGHAGASGAEHAVPGMIVMFSFFVAGMVGFSFFREHGWSTWDRLRTSQATSIEILLGKVLPSFGVTLTQQLMLFAVGVVVFGLAVGGAVPALVLLSASLAACLVSLGVLLAAIFRSAQQLNAVVGVSTMTMAGLGGAFAPLSVLPGWAQTIAPAVPTYWAMEGFRAALLDGTGLAGAAIPALALLAFAGVFAAIATRRFRFDEAKRVNH
jgi:ABC-2 type transport system permease protein